MPFVISEGDAVGGKGVEGNLAEEIVPKSKARHWQRNRKESRLSSIRIDSQARSGPGLLSLPTELRLNIFRDLFDNQPPVTLFNGSDFIVLVNSAQRETANKSGRAHVTDILRVCRQIHDEAEDAFYESTLFGIIASPYQAVANHPNSLCALKTVRSGSIAVSTLKRIRKLLFVMHLRDPHYVRHGYRVADLRYLQAMTNLKEIRVVFTAARNASFLDVHMAPIRAIIESIPSSARVKFGSDSSRPSDGKDRENVEVDAGPSINAAVKSGSAELVYQYARNYASRVTDIQGTLAGSTIDHSSCCFKNCVEGKGCANSQLDTPPPKKPKAVSKFLHALAPVAGIGPSWHRMDL